MNTVYVCSPYKGTPEEVARNIEYAKELTRGVLLDGDSAIAPHLYITQCLDDTNAHERSMGMNVALGLLYKCDSVVVGMLYGISLGMAAEIEEAKRCNIPVLYVN